MPTESRYQNMRYRRCGRSGVQLPAVSLGLWHNFGDVDAFDHSRAMIRRAFDLGITHFDLADNYGPPPGAAERTFGRVLAQDLHPYRDEMIVSTKAGYDMWPGPYGNWGSRKHLIAGLDQSLRRMGLDYVDIFYHHRPDPETPLEEAMGALDTIVRSGRALYAGLSSYSPEQTREAAGILDALGTPCLIHQPPYNMFRRAIESGLLETLEALRIGCIVFCPLAQGLLTDKYLNGIPADSRAAKPHGALAARSVTPEKTAVIAKLDALARTRDQTLAQMALAWALRPPAVASALIGASRTEQVEQAVAALDNLAFSEAETAAIDALCPA